MKFSKKGINPLVSSIAVIGIILISSIIVTSMISPVMKRGEENQIYNEAKQKMSSLNALINELYYEAPGAARIVKMDVEGGKFVVSGGENKLKYVLDARMLESVTRTKEGNVIISSGPFVKAYEGDPDGDGITDLVLENDDVLFAVRKYQPSNGTYPGINTSSLISIIKNKKLNTDIRPKSAIYVNGTNDVGTGYTELTAQGNDLSSAGIRLFMNATIIYEAIFTLDAGADFVNLEIRVRQ
jgi:hypothetical protein